MKKIILWIVLAIAITAQMFLQDKLLIDFNNINVIYFIAIIIFWSMIYSLIIKEISD
jgi:hypothetical protein